MGSAAHLEVITLFDSLVQILYRPKRIKQRNRIDGASGEVVLH